MDDIKSYLQFTSSEVSADDEDVLVYKDVTVLRDMEGCPGIEKGKRFMQVSHNKVSECLVFHLRSGSCKLVSFAPKKKPQWMGEHKTPQQI